MIALSSDSLVARVWSRVVIWWSRVRMRWCNGSWVAEEAGGVESFGDVEVAEGVEDHTSVSR